MADINSKKDMVRLLELGKKLTINLDDYVDLRAFHNDMEEWRRKTQQILSG